MIIKRKVPQDKIDMLKKEAPIHKNYIHYTGDDPLELIKAYTKAIFKEVTPSPDILVSIAENFASYRDSGGKIDLDTAFGLKAKQKSGHPVKVEKEKFFRMLLHRFMFSFLELSKKSGIRLSKTEAARLAIANENERVKGFLNKIEPSYELNLLIGAAKAFMKTRIEEGIDAEIDADTLASEYRKSKMQELLEDERNFHQSLFHNSLKNPEK